MSKPAKILVWTLCLIGSGFLGGYAGMWIGMFVGGWFGIDGWFKAVRIGLYAGSVVGLLCGACAAWRWTRDGGVGQ